MKKSRVWQAIVPGTQTKPQDALQIRKTPWHGVTKQPRHTNQATRHPSNQENTLARHEETASCPEPNEKIKGLAGNCSRHTKQATRHPSNQENTLARRDETGNSCGTLLWDTLLGHSCRTLLWDTLVGHSCGTLWLGHSCGTLLWDTLVGHSCGILL